MNETKYGLRLSSHLNHLKNSLPQDGNVKIVDSLDSLSDYFDGIESSIGLRCMQIANHNERSQTEEAFKVSLFERYSKITHVVDDLSAELKKEIKKYYSITIE